MKSTNFCFLILSLVFLSCSQNTFNINSSTKRINYPGISTAKAFVSYEIDFESKNNFSIQNIQLNNQQEIIDFSLYQLASRNSISGKGMLDKGKYIVSFMLNETDKIDVSEEVTIKFKIGARIETYKTKLIKKEPFRLR